MSNEQLVSLAPSGRSLEQLKRELTDGNWVLLSDAPILPLFRYQSGDWVANIQDGISPHAVNQIQTRLASAGSSAYFKTSTGSLAPAIEPVYSPDPSLTQIAPTTAPTAKISPKFAQARRRLELELVYDDKEETAAGKVPYRVEFSDGSQKSGVLNAKGWACMEDCPNGEATVIFGDEAERQSAEQRLPGLYRQLAASLDTAAAEMAKKSEQLAAQVDVQQISDSFRQKVDAQLAELTAQREQFNQQQIWQQVLQTGLAYKQGLRQGTASVMDDLLDFNGLMAFLEEADISLSLLLEAIMTGDVDALETKLAQWRARSENGLKATGEAMEMLILLLKDEHVRALLQSLPLRYLDALPKDKLAEIVGYMHSRVSLDGMLEMSLVLLAALVGSIFGMILMFLVVTKRRASRIISPASSVLEDIAKAQKAIRNDHAIQTYIGKHQTPLNSKTPKGDVDTPLKSQENAGGDVPNRKVIELEPGQKGGWNKTLNKQLDPNTDYKVGNYTYQTDSAGNVNRVHGKLKLETRDRNTHQQTKSAEANGIKDGLQTDDGGHLVASIFDGPGEQINYSPMNSNLNRGRWKRMENKWADALKSGKEVSVDIKPIYEGASKRPTAFDVKYWIDGKQKQTFFENRHGG
ncbi:DNA/RNA non-specific endonuclease [Shewanella carassii]|uniref:DNA/RNA non-specific endonuclease n=1 Tax=Shewanella carassii TaxID=1987584 RepID=UPI00197EA3CF|nr:DNA/RNA non-specific endonuclease [Shewanella carassii]